MFTVGAFARLAGVSAKVLRSWDELGLFRPAWIDRSSAYRYYTPAQLPELRRIQALRDVGMALVEIRALVTGGADLRAAIDRRRAELEAEREEADRRLAALDIRIDPAGVAGAELDVVVRRIEPELVATFDLDLAPSGDVGRAFYELESAVRDAGARANRPPGAIADEGLIFVPLRRTFAAGDRIGVRRLPSCRAVTILHRGDYDTIDATRRDLEGWARRAGYTAAGPLRTLYLQFGAEPELGIPRGWTVGSEGDFVTELQLPVSPPV